jgi:hypothetical protein
MLTSLTFVSSLSHNHMKSMLWKCSYI